MSDMVRFSNKASACALFVFGVMAGQVVQAATPKDGGLVTLYSHDPVAHTLCFADGEYGLEVQDRQVKNRCSDLDFDNYNPLYFTSGVGGARKAAIINIGTEPELQAKYGYQQTYGATHGFSSIQLSNGKLYIRQGDGRAVQEMTGTELLFAKSGTLAKSTVQPGHIYLLHITDGHDPLFDKWVKLLVVSYAQGDSVTVRWQRL
jgi:hypothetical protein